MSRRSSFQLTDWLRGPKSREGPKKVANECGRLNTLEHKSGNEVMEDVKRVLSQMNRRFRRSRLVMAPPLCRKITGYAPKASKLAKRIAGYFSKIWFAEILQYESELFRPDFFHFKDAPNLGVRIEHTDNPKVVNVMM